MSEIWSESVSSVNSYVRELAANGDDYRVTLAVFDLHEGLQFQVLREAVPASEWKALREEEAPPRGSTPLLDSLVRIIAMAEQSGPQKAVIVVVTDGYENASREATLETARAAIERVEKRGWQVVFLGADFDAFAQSQELRIDRRKQMSMSRGHQVEAMRRTAEKSKGYFAYGEDIYYDDRDRFASGERKVSERGRSGSDTMLYEALREPYVIISVMGPHAGEDEVTIFNRKLEEVRVEGRSFWVHSSSNAKPDVVKILCKRAAAEGRSAYCIFIEPSSPGGSQQTSAEERATMYSPDGHNWLPVPAGIKPTGNISRGATALVFDAFEIVRGYQVLDLWEYSDFGRPGRALPIRQGGSTVCAERISSAGDPAKIKSNRRVVVAVAKLADPYAVWLRADSRSPQKRTPQKKTNVGQLRSREDTAGKSVIPADGPALVGRIYEEVIKPLGSRVKIVPRHRYTSLYLNGKRFAHFYDRSPTRIQLHIEKKYLQDHGLTFDRDRLAPHVMVGETKEDYPISQITEDCLRYLADFLRDLYS